MTLYKYNYSSTATMIASSSSIANSMMEQIYNKTTQKMRMNDMIRQMPRNMQQNIHAVNHQILSSYALPKPSLRKQKRVNEDVMPDRYLKQSLIQSKIPVFKNKDQYLSKTGDNFYDKYRVRSTASRYTSTPNLQNIQKKMNAQFINCFNSNNTIMKLEERGATARSFKSVLQLQSQINKLRKTYLQLQREKKKQMELIKPQKQSKKRLSKDYTFDYNYKIIDKMVYGKGSNIRAPLQSKSISANKLVKKVKNEHVGQDDKNVEEELARMNTGCKQRQLRVFGNFNRRQISHFPYIQLTQNSKLFQNLNIFHGPSSPTSQSSVKKQNFSSGFKSFFQNNLQIQPVSQLITQDADEMSFPLTSQIQMKNLNDGQISKNTKYFSRMSLNKSGTSSKDIPLDYKPVNSPKRNALDQYYNMKAVIQ